MKTAKSLISALLTIVILFSIVSCGAAGGDGNYAGAPNAPMAPSDDGMMPDLSGEGYTEIVENGFVSVSESASSYFSIDVNTASYPNLRSLITDGVTNIPRDAVRIEEMLNYFNYSYDRPEGGEVFALNAAIFDNPYNPETKLFKVGLAAEAVEFSEVKNNLVFLIDVSGSMASSDKLPLVQQAFTLLAENLNDEDRVSVVTYAGSSGVRLEGAFGYEKQKICAVIEDLMAGGGTAGSEGINTAYAIAEKYFIEGGNNRVILATDGDFNIGVTGKGALEALISEKRDTGVYFSVFGVGRGNLKSDTAETLALAGNGAYSYIDSVKEARRALVEEIGGSMVTVAKDVKAGITFNPEYINEYRLIGYENKLLTEDEFNDESTDAGEVGSGHTVTVVYEVKMTDKADAADNVADVIIRYKPTENSSTETQDTELTLAVTSESLREASDEELFVAAVIEFGLILRESEYKAEAELSALLLRLEGLSLTDEYMIEFRELVAVYSENISEQ